MADAVANSYDARTAGVVTHEYRADAHAAAADYYPTIQAFLALEHDQVLKNTPVPFFSVGTTTVNAITRFQNLFGFQANWTVTDFGVRFNNMRAARRNSQAYALKAATAVRDVRLQVIDDYEKALTAFKTLKFKEMSVAVYRQLYDLKNRCYQSGSCSRVDLAEQSLQLAQAEDAVRDARESLIEKLSDLTSLTHRSYNADDVQLADFDEPGVFAPPVFVARNLPDWRVYDLQISAKQAEIKSLWAQQLPKIALYSGLIFYGTNPVSWPESFTNIAPRVVDNGISIQWNLFDGFKLSNQRERKRWEIEQLKLERDKKVWDLQSQYQKSVAMLTPLRSQLSTKAEIINYNQQKIGMYQRLVGSNVTDPTALLKQQAALIDQQLSQEKVRIQQAAAMEKLRIITGV